MPSYLWHHRQLACVGHAAACALAMPRPADKVRTPTANDAIAVRRAKVGISPEAHAFFSNSICRRLYKNCKGMFRACKGLGGFPMLRGFSRRSSSLTVFLP